MKRTTLVIALWAVLVATMSAQKTGNEQQLAKEANEYFASGDFLKAYPLYSQLVSLYPQNADYSYRFGACAIYSDPDKSKAIKFLNSATKRNVADPMAWYYLGKAYHLNYQFKEAVKSYEEFVTKADPKISAKYNAQREIETCIYGSNLLSNIKDVVVINKVEADRNSFFRYMDLDGIGGKILTVPLELQTKLDQKSNTPGVIHYPGNSTTIYFSSYGLDGSTGKDIYKAQILPDGKFTKAEKVKGDINTKYDEDYCFLHSDGKTLYFASKGHNSMGGFDIFKSVMDPVTGVFGPAINLDFAINTPDDDIFYIADSLNQKAYFASGRSSDQNHLHVYNVMVQGIPLQIVYLKGLFQSEIDVEQKNATIQVRDVNTGRVVMENNTNGENGNYTLYVPKAGEYKFYVKTENSPVIHETDVTIPPFDKPVALRQEMKLIKENGQEKLIVTNYFNEILNEDMAALAQEMLRRKAGLEVNDSPTPTATSQKKELALSVEKTMQNVTLAAGFGNDVTVNSVITDMQKDVDKATAFIASADKKINAAYHNAKEKEQKANELTAKAELLKNNISGAMNDDEIQNLRESQIMLREAQALKREAFSSLMAAKAIQNEKLVAKAELEAISQNLEELKKNNSAQNFDGTLIALQKEKERIVANRMSKDDGLAIMNKDARAKEDELHKSEDKLNYLRQSEKEKQREIALLEEKKSNTKKKSEQATLETAIVNAKSDLDGIRRGILDRNRMTEKLGKETRDAYAAIEIYERLNKDENLGYSVVEGSDDTQRSTIAMRIDALESRFDQLIITDPQTLALINLPEESQQKNQAISATNETVNDVKNESTLNSQENNRNNTSQPVTANVTESPNKNSTEETTAIENANNADTTEENATSTVITENAANEASTPDPVSANTIDSNGIDNAVTNTASNGDENNVSTFNTIAIEKVNTLSPGNVAAQRMIAVNSAQRAEERIKEIQKKRTSGITSEEKAELQTLIAFRDEQKSKATPPNTASYTNDNLRAIATSVQPEYAGALIDIENQEKSELEKTKDRVAFQKSTIEKLKLTRAGNAARLVDASNAAEINEISKRDQELEAAILFLEKETTSVNTYKAAFDLENKEIIQESNQRIRLEEQVALTENYINTLESLEAEYREQLALSTDLKESETIRMQIGETVKEKQLAEARLNGYQSDLQLTANASEPVPTDTAATAASLEEEIENELAENPENVITSIEDERAKIEEDAKEIKSIMKPRTESESIFAYESPVFQQLMSNQSETAAQLKEQEKINTLQSQIVLLEAEIEMEQSTRKQKKLDKQAEKLYTKKAELELKNTDVIERMTQAEYYKLIGEVDQQNNENQEYLNSRITLRDEVQKLYSQSSNNIEEAKALREKAGPINDPLEKNDYYRQAFAKEALAINQLQQILEIHDNKELLLSYDDQELAELRYGKAENVRNIVSETLTEELPSTDMVIDSKQVIAEGDPVVNVVITPERNVRSEEAPIASVPSEGTSAASPSVGNSPVARAEAGYYANEDASNYYFSFPENLERNLFVRTRTAVYSANAPIPMNPAMPKGVYYSVQIGAFRNPIPQNLYDEFAPIVGDKLNNGITRYIAGFFLTFENADEVKAEIRRMGYSDAFVVAYRDGKRIPLYEAMGKTEQDVLATVEKEYIYGDKGEAPVRDSGMNGSVSKPSTTTNDSKESTSSSSTSPSTASTSRRIDYYKGVKDAAPATQVETVKGLFFTVQVGVYSKPVPASNLKNINPLNSELTQNEKIRYTSGIYNNLEDAVGQRNAAKQLGIVDAFITAYFNGNRITLSEADRLLKENGPAILVK